MHPILFKIGPLTIRTYGLMIVIAILVGAHLATREARRKEIEEAVIYDLILYLILFGLIGSRLLYCLYDLGYFIENPLEIFAIWRGGLSFYGGLIGGFIASLWFVKSRDLPFLKLADIVAPPIILGYAIGRLGCLMAGCCFGIPAHLPWCINFSNPDSLAPLHTCLHPIQIYKSVLGFCIFLLLFLYRKRVKFTGQLFLVYVSLYSIIRFFLDFLRGDAVQIIGWLTLTQAISLLILSLVLFFYQRIISLETLGKHKH